MADALDDLSSRARQGLLRLMRRRCPRTWPKQARDKMLTTSEGRTTGGQKVITVTLKEDKFDEEMKATSARQ